MKVKLGRHEVQVDPEDAYLVLPGSGYSFQVQDRSTKNYTRYYVKARRNREGGSKPYLHRIVMGAKKGQHIDHINGDGRDNRKANLRVTDCSCNMANQRRPVGVSGFRGVVQSNGDCNAWTARLTLDGKPVYSCGHATPEAAARARDELALKFWGEHAVLNFPIKGRKQAVGALEPGIIA